MALIRVLNLFTIMNRGGAESMIMNYYRALDKTKIQFDFVVHRDEEGAFDTEIRALGGRVFKMKPIHPKYIAQYKKMICDFLDTNEYLIIHSHMSELGYYFFKEAKKRNIPFRINHAHNVPVFKQLSFKEKLKWLPRIYLRNKMRKVANEQLACSFESGLWLHGNDNFELLKNAISVQEFAFNQDRRATVRKKLNIKKELVIGHVGRFNHQKNHHFLIDIFYNFVKIKPNSKLILVGEGNLKTTIQQKVQSYGLSDSVLFLGNRDDVSDLMQGFDLLLFPSFFEGFPVVLIEAQASGLPCFMSDTITKEIDVTDTIQTLPLDANVATWVNKIVKHKSQDRSEMHKRVREQGYDVIEATQCLTNYYIKKAQKK